MSRSAFSLLLLLVACGPKNVEVAPPVGWYTEAPTKKTPGWSGSCYFPPDWESLNTTERRSARQKALEEMKKQWLGQRDDGVSFEAGVVDDVETTLLGRPDRIEEVTAKNVDHCQQVMAAGMTTANWSSWLAGLSAQLTAGECNTPLINTIIQYLDINRGWQEDIPMCQGDRMRVTASSSDRYRISEDGEWINAEGDLSQPSTNPELPCNFEGCYLGQLIGRFTSDAGVETVIPLGILKEYMIPDHGSFSFAINDDTYYDNEWRKEGAITDHTAVTISPAD